MTISRQPAADLVTAHAGHDNIQDDEVGFLGLCSLQTLRPIIGSDDLKAVSVQDSFGNAYQGTVVVHDENTFWIAHDHRSAFGPSIAVTEPGLRSTDR